jgi:PAS domain S-box-containing protein
LSPTHLNVVHRNAALPRWLRSGSVAWIGSLLACVAAACVAASLWREANMLEAGELQGNEMFARVLQGHAQRTFDTIDISLTALAEAADTEVRADRVAEAGPSLIQAQLPLPFLRSLSVMDGAGVVLASSVAANVGVVVDLGRVPLPQEGLVDRLGGSVAGRDLADAQPREATRGSPASARTFIPLVRRIGDEGAEPLYIVAVLNPEFFSSDFDLVLADATRHAGLFSMDGTMLAGSAALRTQPGQRVVGNAFFEHYLPARESGSMVAPGIDGARVVTAFRLLRTLPVVVVVERGHDEIVASVRRLATVAVGALAALWLAIGLMTALARRSLRGHEEASAALEAAGRALEAQLAFSARLLEVSPTPLFVQDEHGRFVTANKAWLAMMGMELQAVLGRDARELFGNRMEAPDAIDLRSMQLWVPSRYELRLAMGDMRPRDTVVTKVRFSRADGTPDGVVGSIVDVTEFRDAERDIRFAHDSAQHASQAKSQFIADISHELRTPLQEIIGFSELGRDMTAESPGLADLFVDIHAGGQRMLTLVNGLLDVSLLDDAVGSFALSRQDVHAIVQAAAHAMSHEASLRRQVLRLAPTSTVAVADVDAARLQRACMNVIANSIRYAPAGSTIDIVCAEQAGGGVHIVMRDRGPGFPEDETESVFEAFVQSSRTRDGSGGTGLGLTIARKILGAHGGRITAGNADGGGALVQIHLPRPGARGDAARHPAMRSQEVR